ncbi:MAG: RloB domain-containing protein [Bacteroidetes bacterium]|nr:MAG: RloB domain-containing protein [Bacteroidota bacterium]
MGWGAKQNGKAPSRQASRRILIVCEGAQTEPTYFRQFRLATVSVKVIGTGYNTVSLVRRTEQLLKEEGVKYDEVWCVFDKDDFSEQQFNGAIKLAESLQFFTAWSNQAFEYWLLLHFEDHQGGGMHRNMYCQRLNKHLQPYRATYSCTQKRISPELFHILMGNVSSGKGSRADLAAERAERIYKKHIEDSHNPALSESCTLVYQLYKRLINN